MKGMDVEEFPTIPRDFDARKYHDDAIDMRGNIHEARNQGDCGASWAFSTASVASDRLAINSAGKKNKLFSPQQLLSCNSVKQQGCDGGHIDRAWYYLKRFGGVSEECYHYTSGKNSDVGICLTTPADYRDNKIACPNSGGDNKVYRSSPPYRVKNDVKYIQADIMTQGPVQASFQVHEDFFMYRDGVYQKTPYGGGKSSYHSVKIIGWGEENVHGRTVPYWLCINSWGTIWGDHGTFKILRGQDHCEIESFVIGALGPETNAKKRKLRFRAKTAKQ